MRGHLWVPDENDALARGRKKGNLFARHHVSYCWVKATCAGDETILAHLRLFFCHGLFHLFAHGRTNQGPENPKGKKTLFL